MLPALALIKIDGGGGTRRARTPETARFSAEQIVATEAPGILFYGIRIPGIPIPRIPIPGIPIPGIPVPELPVPAVPVPAIPAPEIGMPGVPFSAIPYSKPPRPERLDPGLSVEQKRAGAPIPIPIPLFPFWPAVGLTWLALLFGQGFNRRDSGVPAWRAGRLALEALFLLSGTTIDIRPASGEVVYLRLI